MSYICYTCVMYESQGAEKGSEELANKKEQIEQKTCPMYKGSTGTKVTDTPNINCNGIFMTYGRSKAKEFEKQFDTCINNPENCKRDKITALNQLNTGIEKGKLSAREYLDGIKQVMNTDEQSDAYHCETCAHSEDYGESVEYIKCAASGKRKDVRKKQAACHNYVPDDDVIDTEPEGDLEEQLDELLAKGDAEDKVAKDRELLSTLVGKEIRTHYNTGGIVTNVYGPHNAYGPGSWSINYTKDGKQSKSPCIINSIKVEHSVILCEGKPLQIVSQEESVTSLKVDQIYIYRGLV